MRRWVGLVSDYIKKRAQRFVKEGKVKVIEVTRSWIDFKVGETPTTVSRVGRKWHCLGRECSSFRGGGVKECSHIYACKLWLEGYGIDIGDINDI